MPATSFTRATPFAAIEQRDWSLLSARFGDVAEREVRLTMDEPGTSYFERLRRGPAQGRRGDVVLVLRDVAGRVWLHTKPHYPAATYRLPTGGVHTGELAMSAARRECLEEAGLDAEPADCLGILRYELERWGQVIRFISYVFVFDAAGHAPRCQDASEHICDFRLIAHDELESAAAHLRRLPPGWRDWGRFRALAHAFVLDHWR